MVQCSVCKIYLLFDANCCCNVAGDVAEAGAAALSSSDVSASSASESRSGVPEFYEQPDEIMYLVKSRPVTLVCKASPAAQVNFKCAGQWVRPKHHVIVEEVDPDSGRKYLISSIQVTRQEVEEYFGLDGYWCECHAWNNVPNLSQPLSAVSRKGLIQIACKYYSHTIFIGSLVILTS